MSSSRLPRIPSCHTSCRTSPETSSTSFAMQPSEKWFPRRSECCAVSLLLWLYKASGLCICPDGCAHWLSGSSWTCAQCGKEYCHRCEAKGVSTPLSCSVVTGTLAAVAFVGTFVVRYSVTIARVTRPCACRIGTDASSGPPGNSQPAANGVAVSRPRGRSITHRYGNRRGTAHGVPLWAASGAAHGRGASRNVSGDCIPSLVALRRPGCWFRRPGCRFCRLSATASAWTPGVVRHP